MATIVRSVPISATAKDGTSSTTSSSSSAGEVPSLLSASSRHQLLLLRVVHSLYRRWAHFIVRNARAVILSCTALSILCTIKVATTPQKNDITGYTPYGARSRNELAVREQFFNAGGLGPPFGVFLLLLPLDNKNGNFLSAKMLAEAALVDDIVRHRFALHNHETNASETFAQFCRDFCDLNEPLRRFEEGFRFQSTASNDSTSIAVDSAIRLDYPVSSILGRKFNIQPNFFGIHFRREKESKKGPPTNMARVEMVALTYKAERVGGWNDDEVKHWEMSVSRYFENEFNSSLVRVLSASTTYVEVEVVRAGLSMLPFLVVGFAIMAVCSSASVLLSALYWRQMNTSKILLALMACVCPFMACGTALGLLFLCGVRFGSVLCVTPFLVLAIGVDIHAWQRVTHRMRETHSEEGGNSVARRLELVLVDTGPAILISALTNICADAVGSFTGSPEITLLCVGNMAAIAVDFVYQVTFYAAVMALVGQMEMRAEARDAHRVRIPIGWTTEEAEHGIEAKQWRKAITRSAKMGFPPALNRQLNSLVDRYVQLVAHPLVAGAICALWLAFLALSSIGISRFEVNLSTKKLFAADSPLLEIDHYREEHIVPFFSMATVFVQKPGNLSDPHRLARVTGLVEEIERIPGAWGPQSTNFFVRELLVFEGEEGGAELGLDFAQRVDEFLQWGESNFWRAFLRMEGKNGTSRKLNAFFFTTAFHGSKLQIWAERTRLLMEWRAVADRFPELNASVFHDEGIFLDLIDNMPSDAWQSAVYTLSTFLAAMCAVCAAFMGHDWCTVGVAGALIASIIVGTLGTLSWIGTSMDPIMMAAFVILDFASKLIISIGFSVDIPAHVAYHFHSSTIELQPDSVASTGVVASVPARLKATLSSVGLPALQASLSTSLCVLSLLFMPLYMAQIFVCIMCITIVLCVLHSLLLLPALFALMDTVSRTICGRSKGEQGA